MFIRPICTAVVEEWMRGVCTGSLASSVLSDIQNMRPWMISLNKVYQVRGVSSILEPVRVARGDGKRLDGITVFPFSNERSLCWDATCTDTYADINIYSSAVSVEHAARETEEQRRRKYGTLGDRFRVKPVAVHTADVYGVCAVCQFVFLTINK